MCVGASIITNFGCDTNCSYCIWNKHPLKSVYTTQQNTDWDALKTFVSGYRKISISGGGDPFYNYKTNKPWYDSLFDNYSGLVDVHTSKILPNNTLKRFNKIVLHCSYNRFISELSNIQNINNPLRLVFVITPYLTKNQIYDIIEKGRGINCQISFRELYSTQDNLDDIHYYIKGFETDSQIKLVKQADYNKYFMPDNIVWDRFMEKK